jgi:hypothetical protein
MRVREGDLQAVAAAVTRGLKSEGFVRFKTEDRLIQRRIVELIAHSFEQEHALQAEAERLAEVHAGKLPNLDFRRIVKGIMERLAKERDFPL